MSPKSSKSENVYLPPKLGPDTAFPVNFEYVDAAGINQKHVGTGMSLRDYFAAKTLTGIFASDSHRGVASAIESDCIAEGIISSPTDIGHFAEQRIAAMAYAMADAMLAERAK